MKETVAERKLLYSLKNEKEQHEFIIYLGSPYFVTEGTVNFSVGSEGCWGCAINVSGLNEDYSEKIYGADSLQTIELAVKAIEFIIKRIGKKYDIFYLSSEPYL